MNTEQESRFWDRVSIPSDVMNGCWEWSVSRSGGYGRFGLGGKSYGYAHRISFELVNGPLPIGHFACHRCDNRGCVNPGHLFSGDATANNRDMTEKGRHGGANKTHCVKGHELSGENLAPWSKLGNRLCLECSRIRVRNFMRVKRAKNREAR